MRKKMGKGMAAPYGEKKKKSIEKGK